MGPLDPDFFDSEEMRAALAARDIGTVYRLLTRRGVSQRRIARLTGQSQSEVSEILNGRQVVNVWVLERIATGLGTPRAWMGLSYGDQAPATPKAKELSAAMKRRGLVFTTIGAGTGQAFEGLPELTVPTAPTLPARVEMVHVHIVRAVTDQLRGLARYYGGQADLLGAAVALYTPWMHVLGTDDTVTAALAAALAELHTEAGWCHHDAGLDGTAHFACALHLAGKTRDHYGIANAAWHAGLVLVRTGHPNDALKLLQLGQVQLHQLAHDARVAVLAARLGRTSAAAYARMSGVDEATCHLADANEGWEPQDIFEHADGDLATAMIHRDLGDLDTAERFATSAAHTYSQARTITQLLLAELHLRAGEPQGLILAHHAIKAASALQSVAIRREWLPVLAAALETRPSSDAQKLARTARQIAKTQN